MSVSAVVCGCMWVYVGVCMRLLVDVCGWVLEEHDMVWRGCLLLAASQAQSQRSRSIVEVGGYASLALSSFHHSRV